MRGSAVARAERVKRGWSSADAVPPSEKVALTWAHREIGDRSVAHDRRYGMWGHSPSDG